MKSKYNSLALEIFRPLSLTDLSRAVVIDIHSHFHRASGVNSPQRDANEDAPSPVTKEQFVAQLMKNPVEFFHLMMGPDCRSSFLASGLMEHLENTLELIQEIGTGSLQLPNVHNGLPPRANDESAEDWCNKIGNDVFLHKDCFVSL